MFLLNDIVYARVQYSGASYHHVFGKIIKVTLNGKFRVQPIGTKYGETKEDRSNDGIVLSRTRDVEPDENENVDQSFLIDKRGKYSKDKLVYLKYQKGVKIINYIDFGD